MKNFITKFLVQIAFFGFLIMNSPMVSGETATEPTNPEYPASMASGSLPIIHINTEGNAPILDRETKIPATFSMDCSMTDEFEDVSERSLTVKGRGNYTWTAYAKKPYQLEFTQEQSLFGMPSSKEYALLAEMGLRGFGTTLGTELGKALGMPWVPRFQAVELVVNGSYQGLYLLVETIKIQPGRLDISEQSSDNADLESIPYGWLLEIDAYKREGQVLIQETPESVIRLRIHTPSSLSGKQYGWIEEEFRNIISLLNNDDRTSPTWTDKIDMTSLARYFVVQELLCNTDAYFGSFFWYKDSGVDSKWRADLLWDTDEMSNSEGWSFELRDPKQAHIIQLAKNYPVFIDEVKRVWAQVSPEMLSGAYDKLSDYQAQVKAAYICDDARWPQYRHTFDLSYFDSHLPKRYNFIETNLEALYQSSLEPTEPTEPTEPEYPASMASGTLPIIHINTEGNAPILDKETKIPATFSMDCSMTDEFEDFGEVTMTIKGRGNHSWFYCDKKPYKIKFDKKQSLFGLPKSKHYALLAETSTRGLTTLAAFELGRAAGMSWAPHFQPVELILNGEYKGLYLLIESVKIGEGRIDIFEQEDNNEDETTIPYGWLVEVDNYADPNQLQLQEADGKKLRLTYKSPGVLSPSQEAWLAQDFQELLDLLANGDVLKPQWTNKLDVHSLAQYFVVTELMGNRDGYNGSFYFHKGMGDEAKWTAGPLWDLDNVGGFNGWVFEVKEDKYVHLIKDAVRYPVFLDEVRRVYDGLLADDAINKVTNTLSRYEAYTGEAKTADSKRWSETEVGYGKYNLDWVVKDVLQYNERWFTENFEELYERIELPEEPVEPEFPASMASGTLPIVYINTENGAPIVDKETKIPATFSMDCSMTDEFEDFGEVTMTIKGRGNYSWTRPKKPYKLKFDKKQSLFGLPKSKHYSLLAEEAVRGLTSLGGFEIGRLVGMEWVPSLVPVELVLNGNYQGHYLLIENVKIQEGRVDIFEQEDGNTDAETIPYGWLVEIDNYDDEYQIILQETPEMALKLTHHSPEVLSEAQREWLKSDFQDLLDRLYNDDTSAPSWTEKLDVHSLAQYFLATELSGNVEGYHGSFYLYKDMEEDSKWKAGPLWDIDNVKGKNEWIFENRTKDNHIIGQAVRYPVFLEEVRSIWETIKGDMLEHLFSKLDDYETLTEQAIVHDLKRWNEKADEVYYRYFNCDWVKNSVLAPKYKWFENNFENLFPVITGVEGVSGGDAVVTVRDGELLIGKPGDVERIVVSDIAGRTLELEPAREIKLPELVRGVYIIRVTDKSGMRRSVKHFVN